MKIMGCCLWLGKAAALAIILIFVGLALRVLIDWLCECYTDPPTSRLASLGEVPYYASLLFKGSYHCGATVISKRHVITAASCYDHGTNATQFSVAVATNVLPGGIIYPVHWPYLHPFYRIKNPDKDNYDIAVVLLLEEMTFGPLSFVNSIALATGDEIDKTTTFQPTVAGFGLHDPEPKRLTIYSGSELARGKECPADYDNMAAPRNTFCAKVLPDDASCHVTRGDPMTVDNGTLQLLGFFIRRPSSGCGKYRKMLFLHVADYIGFIRRTVKASLGE